MRWLSFSGALFGASAVGLGAFGAHGLEEHLTPKSLGWWETATFYLLVHAGIVFAVGLSGRSVFAVAGWLLLAGTALFAATLYLMALGAPSTLGMVTPVGGALMITGWLYGAFTCLRRRSFDD